MPCSTGQIKLMTSGCVKVWSDEEGTSLLLGQNESHKFLPVLVPETVWVEAASGGTGWLYMVYVISYRNSQNVVEPNEIDQIGKQFTATSVVIDSVEIAVGSDTPDICEDVVFEVETSPSGYEKYVQWSGGGCPNTEGQGELFTTAWPCIGNKTVTATLCNSSLSEGVSVQLPGECGMAGTHNSSVDWITHRGDNYFVCNEGPGADATAWHYLTSRKISGAYAFNYDPSLEYVIYDAAFKYRESDCTWVCEISNVRPNTAILIYDPDCNDVTKISISSASEDLCEDINTVVADLADTNLNDDQPGNANPSAYWCYNGFKAHEEKHREDWESMYGPKLVVAIASCEALEIEIDCEDADTWDCADVLDGLQSEIERLFSIAKEEADDLYDPPNIPPDPDINDAEQRAYYEQYFYWQHPILADLWLLCD